MKFTILFVCAAFALGSINAQNLVPDHSFEDYDSCPKMHTNYGFELSLKHWFSPTLASPDYHNACNNSPAGNNVVGVPLNIRGYQAASDSNGYVFIGTWDTITLFDYKEYVSCRLTGCEAENCPLTPGKYYRVSIDVSLPNRCNIACDGLGVYFFTDTLPASYKTAWMTTLPFTPQIDYTPYGAITDTMNWVTLVDTFRADSAYTYMVIGGVTPENSQTRIRVSSDNPIDFSGYYLDNVKVEEVTVTGVQHIELPQLTIAPNPVRDYSVWRLSQYNADPYSISLCNTIGQTVWQRSNVRDKELVFERRSLPAGIYYYQLRMKGKPTLQGKMVLE